MKFKHLVLFVIVLFVFMYAVEVFAQGDDIPDFYKTLLSAEMLVYIGAVCGFTKYVRNIFNVKGKIALLITFVVSLLYSFVQYKALGMPSVIGIGLLAAAAGAGIFKGTKLLGQEVVNPGGTK